MQCSEVLSEAQEFRKRVLCAFHVCELGMDDKHCNHFTDCEQVTSVTPAPFYYMNNLISS
jgi:hypothetical protein